MPWPLRWAAVAIVLGFCGAIGLWAFEFGKEIAGVDDGSRLEIRELRQVVADLRSQRDKAQSVSNTSASLLTTEKATQERLAARVKLLEAENRSIRDDLAFFEHLIPAGSGRRVAIRALRAEVFAGGTLKWQVLVIQPAKRTRRSSAAC